MILPGHPPSSRPLARADGDADGYPGRRSSERAKTAYLRCAETTPCKIPPPRGDTRGRASVPTPVSAPLKQANNPGARTNRRSEWRVYGHGSKQLQFGSTGGVTTATVARIERDEIEPRMTRLRKLADGLDVDPAELVGE